MAGVREFTTADLARLLEIVHRKVQRPARLYLVAGTSQLLEGWSERVPRFELASEPADATQLGRLARDAAASMGADLAWESPADVIPLPAGHERRARPVTPSALRSSLLDLWHFDPYSVVLRLIARGDEPDYRVALKYLEHDWVTFDGLEALLDDVLARFTSETIQQDPAEFRRKFRGLRQMWLARAAWV